MSQTICIILAAGRGSRLKPLTDNCPKPLLEVHGQSLIEHNLEAINSVVDRFIIVTNYLEDMIVARIGSSFKGKEVEHIHQSNPSGGTLDAFRVGVYGSANFDSESSYLISNSDDLHGPDIYHQFNLNIQNNPKTALVSAKILEDQERLRNYGVLEVDSDNNLVRIWEKPQHYVSSLVNTGIYYFPSIVLDFLSRDKKTDLGREEYITEDLFNPYSLFHKIKVLGTTDKWQPINNVTELEMANQK